MASPLTLSHDTLADLVQQIAKQRNASPELVLEELAYRYLDTVPVDLLEDEQVLALADIMLSQEQQNKLNSLLEKQSEGQLDAAGKTDLEALMQVYNHLLLRKGEAMAVAVERGLRQPYREE
jgi:LEA14-like dessication related protein